MTGTEPSGRDAPVPPAHPGRDLLVALARPLVAAAILGPWLLLLTSWQVALFPTGDSPTTALVPPGPVLIVMAVAALARILWRSPPVHVVAIAIVVGGIALLAANPGSPLPSASGNLCSASCRDAIAGRYIASFGWPVLVFIGLAIVARVDGRTADPAARDRHLWSWAWAIAALALGLPAAVAWMRIILPNG